MRVGFVCEGQTDIPVFEALLGVLLPDGWVTSYLKPECDALGNWDSAGWTKVRDFCRSYGSYVAYLPDAPDLLIVQVDSDIRGQLSVPRGLVIVIPTQATETWLLAANRPTNPTIETVKKPADQLIKANLIAHDQHGNPVKDQGRYRELAAPLAERLPSLREILRELDRFCTKVEAVVKTG